MMWLPEPINRRAQCHPNHSTDRRLAYIDQYNDTLSSYAAVKWLESHDLMPE